MLQTHLLDAEESSFKPPEDMAMILTPTWTAHLSVDLADCLKWSGNSNALWAAVFPKHFSDLSHCGLRMDFAE